MNNKGLQHVVIVITSLIHIMKWQRQLSIRCCRNIPFRSKQQVQSLECCSSLYINMSIIRAISAQNGYIKSLMTGLTERTLPSKMYFSEWYVLWASSGVVHTQCQLKWQTPSSWYPFSSLPNIVPSCKWYRILLTWSKWFHVSLHRCSIILVPWCMCSS